MDSSGSKKVEGNFFDKDIFFILWFYWINSCFSEVGIYENNQSTADQKKAKTIETKRANQSGIDGVDAEKSENPSTSWTNVKKVDKPDIRKTNKTSKSEVNKLGIIGAKKLDTGRGDKSNITKAEKFRYR